MDTHKSKVQIKEIQILKNKNGSLADVHDYVAVEAPLQIEIDGKPISVTMRTPGDDIALALGFLFNENLIHDYSEISDVVSKNENTVNIIPEEDMNIRVDATGRNFLSNSSCGVCGKTSLMDIKTHSTYANKGNKIKTSHLILYSLQEKLLTVQSSFEITGGLHACALFTPDGQYLFHSEDVGRHNALDKLIGHALMAGRIPLDAHILLLSGRASFELVQKAGMAGIPIIAAVGAPSSLAIELAMENGQTLVGFLKKNSFNIYTCSERISK